ncbi:MAG TPA: PASTA domain-containing protein [Gaiellaceae bacterium]|jgi:beta-lactam-binding protein with PASTA domain
MRRLLFTAAVFVALAMTAISFAASRRLAVVPTAQSRLPSTPLTLVVPDLRNEAYVFAKGQLQDAGFAWKLAGGLRGYSANVVVSQSPPPGTRLVDTGAPLIKLTLAANKDKHYRAPKGEPQDASPYAGTADRLAGSN